MNTMNAMNAINTMNTVKRLSIVSLAIAGLLASALVAVVAAVAPASAQVGRAGITVRNVAVLSGTSAGDPENQIRVSISPVSDCDPGGGGSC